MKVYSPYTIFLETAVLQKACRLTPTYKFELGISWFSINHRNIDHRFSYEKVSCLKWVLRKKAIYRKSYHADLNSIELI